MENRSRSWHKPMQRMSEVLAISFERQKVKIRHLRGTTHMTVPFDDVELMQSTGLFDKNGVEIFEGDVVSFSIDNGWDYVVSENGLIIYWDGCYQILENGIRYRINQCLEEDIEVIGNIYENPELLEEK